MHESILVSIKKLLGVSPDDDSFNLDILVNINSALQILNQLGIGAKDCVVVDDTAKWRDFINEVQQPMVKTYVYLKVRLYFDPPANSFSLNSLEKLISELEWRLNIEYEDKKVERDTYGQVLAAPWN